MPILYRGVQGSWLASILVTTLMIPLTAQLAFASASYRLPGRLKLL